MERGTNAPGRPQYQGQYVLFRSPHADCWLLDRGEHDARGSLRWAAVNDERTVALAQAGYHAIPLDGVGDRCVRTSTLRQYAVNLMIQGDQGISDADRQAYTPQQITDFLKQQIRSLLLITHQGERCVPFAVAHGLEVDRPRLATLEHMLTIALRIPDDHPNRLTPGARAALTHLRNGSDPSGGLFSIEENILALAAQFPVLQAALDDELKAMLSPEPVSSDCDYSCSPAP